MREWDLGKREDLLAGSGRGDGADQAAAHTKTAATGGGAEDGAGDERATRGADERGARNRSTERGATGMQQRRSASKSPGRPGGPANRTVFGVRYNSSTLTRSKSRSQLTK